MVWTDSVRCCSRSDQSFKTHEFLMPVRERLAVVVTGLLFGLGITATPTAAVRPLRIGAIPDQNPERLNRLHGALSAELSESLGCLLYTSPSPRDEL